MIDLEKVSNNLNMRGFDVTILDSKAAAADYLDSKIDGVTVGVSGSVTLQKMEGFGDRLSHHNTVFWHWYNAVDTHNAISSEVYITSANAIAETGEIVNVGNRGNRVSSMLFGHDRLYFVVGWNKIVPTYEEAVSRARNVACVLNAARIHKDVPCKSIGSCIDCDAPDRPCNALLTHWMRPDFIPHAEVIIIKQDLGL